MSAPGTMHPFDVGRVIIYFILGLVVLYVLAMLIMQVRPVNNEAEEMSVMYTSLEQDLITQAQTIYNTKKEQGLDLSSGPCLTDQLIGGWVVDVAHQPRQAIDDLPENLCPSYVAGDPVQMIELDLDGNLIRLK